MTRSGLVFACLLIKEPEGFTVLCPDLDVASQGGTPAKAKRHLQEAVKLYFDSAIERNLPYLRPVPRDEDPRRTAPDSIIETFNIHVPMLH